MENRFKPGDKVIVTQKNWSAVEVGEIYTILAVSDENEIVRVDFPKYDGWNLTFSEIRPLTKLEKILK
jgi:hypothetical protein